MLKNEPKDPQVHVDPALMDHIKATFPDKVPQGKVTKYDIAKLQGQLEVVRHIEYLSRLKLT